METTPARAPRASCLVFVHIPKAGGTTLQNVLERQYPLHRTFTTHGSFPDGWDSDFRRLPPDRMTRYDLVRGHMHFGLHTLIPAPVRYITMLRHPVKRVVSLYLHARRRSDHYLHRTINERGATLGDLLDEGASTELDNGQTRILAGPDASAIPFGACTRELLERARDNLRTHFAAVGLMERFDQSLLLFADVLGWDTPYYLRRNVAPSEAREEIPADVLARVERHSALDLELYRFAEECLEDALRRRPHVRDRLPTFRHHNARHGKYIALMKILYCGIRRRVALPAFTGPVWAPSGGAA